MTFYCDNTKRFLISINKWKEGLEPTIYLFLHKIHEPAVHCFETCKTGT